MVNTELVVVAVVVVLLVRVDSNVVVVMMVVVRVLVVTNVSCLKLVVVLHIVSTDWHCPITQLIKIPKHISSDSILAILYSRMTTVSRQSPNSIHKCKIQSE